MNEHDVKLPPLAEMRKGSDVRRKLMFALFGGLLMQAIAPLNAVGAESKPKDDKVTEEIILEFLRNLLTLIKHDDLSDVEFLKKTLGVKAVMQHSGVNGNGDSEVFYYLKESKSRLIQENQVVPHTYSVIKPRSGEKSVVDLRLIVSSDSHEWGVTTVNVERIFGQPERFDYVEALASPNKVYMHKRYNYRWPNQNNTNAEFMFHGETGFLMDVTVSQN